MGQASFPSIPSTATAATLQLRPRPEMMVYCKAPGPPARCHPQSTDDNARSVEITAPGLEGAVFQRPRNASLLGPMDRYNRPVWLNQNRCDTEHRYLSMACSLG